jgi:hypothetical protein
MVGVVGMVRGMIARAVSPSVVEYTSVRDFLEPP